MRGRAFITLLTTLLLLLAGLAQAQGEPTTLAILPIELPPLGQSIGVTLHLADAAGALLPHRRLLLYLNGEPLGRTHTNSEGVAKARLDEGLPAGGYTLEAAFEGYKAYRPARTATTFTIEPALLTVKTVPPIAGVAFSLDGYVFATQADGVARTSVAQSGVYTLELLPWKDKATRLSFGRWRDGVYEPRRKVELPKDSSLEAGFDVSYLVKTTFVDLAGKSVSPERITELTFKSSYGATHTLRGAQPVWLQANRVLRRTWGLEEKKIRYALESVTVDGSNVVNRGQQRFAVNQTEAWKIELLLYHARFSAADAVFGFPLGDGVSLEYPDGHKKFLKFGADNSVAVGPLARGLYKAQVAGARGMAPPTPIALSRDQTVALKVLSALDMGVGLSLGLVGALGLLLLGRPQLFGLKRARAKPSTPGWTKGAYSAPYPPDRAERR